MAQDKELDLWGHVADVLAERRRIEATKRDVRENTKKRWEHVRLGVVGLVVLCLIARLLRE